MRYARAAHIACRGFDLGDVGAQIAQRLGAARTGQHAGEIDDPQTFKWRAHAQFPSKTAEPGPVATKAARPRA